MKKLEGKIGMKHTRRNRRQLRRTRRLRGGVWPCFGSMCGANAATAVEQPVKTTTNPVAVSSAAGTGLTLRTTATPVMGQGINLSEPIATTTNNATALYNPLLNPPDVNNATFEEVNNFFLSQERIIDENINKYTNLAKEKLKTSRSSSVADVNRIIFYKKSKEQLTIKKNKYIVDWYIKQIKKAKTSDEKKRIAEECLALINTLPQIGWYANEILQIKPLVQRVINSTKRPRNTAGGSRRNIRKRLRKTRRLRGGVWPCFGSMCGANAASVEQPVKPVIKENPLLTLRKPVNKLNNTSTPTPIPNNATTEGTNANNLSEINENELEELQEMIRQSEIQTAKQSATQQPQINKLMKNLKASENALSRPLDQISNANLEEQLRQLEESIRAT